MVMIDCFIEDRNAIPDFVRITGANIIDVEFEFDKAHILERRCWIKLDLTPAQIEELNTAPTTGKWADRYYSKLRENADLLYAYPPAPRIPVTAPALPERNY